MHEAIADLESIPIAGRNPQNRIRKSTARLRRLVLLVSLAVLATLFYIYRQHYLNQNSDTGQSAQFKRSYISKIIQLTHSGTITKSAISAAGNLVAFVTQEKVGQALWFRQTNGEAQKLHQTSNGKYDGITFSKDGQFIYYVLRQKEHGQLYRMSLASGQPTMVHDDVDSSVSLSWDEKRAAFARYDTNTGRSAVILEDLETGQETNLVTLAPPEYLWNNPVWSPNGKDLLVTVISGSNIGEPLVKLIAFDASGNREPVVQAHLWRWAGTPVWLEEGRIIAIAVGTKTSHSTPLLELNWPQGTSIPLMDDGFNYQDLSASADGSRIVMVRSTRRSVPWIVSLTGPESAEVVDSGDTFYGIAWARSGQLISERNAERDVGSLPDLWSVKLHTGAMKQLTHDGIIAEDPAGVRHKS